MGVSGNSMSGKSFQSFAISEELLQKVTEAVQAGEKQARSSGAIQSFEVFYRGFRQNIAIGRIYVIPASVCSDRKDFPTALLYGCIVREFGGEEVGDMIEKKIGESSFDDYSQADFDAIKEKLFGVGDGKFESLILFAPSWANKRDYIVFKFTKDEAKLKNNLRHQVFACYFDPRLSSAFDALMTNVNTTKVDVTDITPKMPFPFLSEGLLKAYPDLQKQASNKKKIFLTRHTADEITQEVLDPQELNVFESLDQALTEALMPGTETVEEASEPDNGGFNSPDPQNEVPRVAAKIAVCTMKCPMCQGQAVKQNPSDPQYSCGCGWQSSAPAMNSSPEALPHAASKKEAKRVVVPHPEKEGFDTRGGRIVSASTDTNITDAYAKSLSGGFVDKQDWPPKEVKAYVAATTRPDQQSPSSAKDHAFEIDAGKWGPYPLSKSADAANLNAKKQARTAVNADPFLAAYITAAFWSSNDNADESGGDPLESNYDIEDLAPATLAKMQKDCGEFKTQNAPLIERAMQEDGATEDTIAHDFWLTRNGHGAGFRDGDYPLTGDELAAAAKKFGEADLYVGDDGYVYQSGAESGEPVPPREEYNLSDDDKGMLGDMGITGSKKASQVNASYVASQMSKLVDYEAYEAASPKTKKAQVDREAKLAKNRHKQADVPMDIDSIWAEITEDMGPAPQIDLPGEGGATADGGETETTSESTPEGSSDGRPRKKDIGKMPEGFKPFEKKDDAKPEPKAEPEEKEEDKWHVSAREEDFVKEAFEEQYDLDLVPEGKQRVHCDQCQMLSIQGVPCHETGCPNTGARWDAAQQDWVKQRKCFECGSTVDADDPCCSAPSKYEEEFFDNYNEDSGDEMGRSAEGEDYFDGPDEHEASASLEVPNEVYQCQDCGHEGETDQHGKCTVCQSSATLSVHKVKNGGKKAGWTPCRPCGGKGCDLCNGTGHHYQDSQTGDLTMQPQSKRNPDGSVAPAQTFRASQKKADAVQPDVAEAKAEVVSPDTVDSTIQQETKSVSEAAKVGAGKKAEVDLGQLEHDSKGEQDKTPTFGVTIMRPQASMPGIPADQVLVHGYRYPEGQFGRQELQWWMLMPKAEYSQAVNHLRTKGGSNLAAQLYEMLKARGTAVQPGTTSDTIHAQFQNKSASDVSSDVSEAKAEVVSPDTVDSTIQQETKSVEEAAKVASAEGQCPHCNSYDTDEVDAEEGRHLYCHNCEQLSTIAESKIAAAGDDMPEEVPIDLGAGDLADVVMAEEDADGAKQ